MNYRYPLAALFASFGFVAQAETDNFTEMVVRDLLDNGFTQIEVERSEDELWAEGRGEGGSIEVLYDRETGAILSEERRYDEDDEDEDFDDIEIAIRDVDEDDDEDNEFDEVDEDEDEDFEDEPEDDEEDNDDDDDDDDDEDEGDEDGDDE